MEDHSNKRIKSVLYLYGETELTKDELGSSWVLLIIEYLKTSRLSNFLSIFRIISYRIAGNLFLGKQQVVCKLNYRTDETRKDICEYQQHNDDKAVFFIGCISVGHFVRQKSHQNAAAVKWWNR